MNGLSGRPCPTEPDPLAEGWRLAGARHTERLFHATSVVLWGTSLTTKPQGNSNTSPPIASHPASRMGSPVSLRCRSLAAVERWAGIGFIGLTLVVVYSKHHNIWSEVPCQETHSDPPPASSRRPGASYVSPMIDGCQWPSAETTGDAFPFPTERAANRA